MSDKQADQTDLMERLSDPFEPHEVKFKPAVVSGNRAMALAYVDARVIMERLDDVMGLANWQDEYEFLPNGSVVCRLKLRIDGEWLIKSDVGSPSEQPDEGDRLKAAVSDSLKRTAVKWGVSRYLYRLPRSWCDYDPTKKQFTKLPQLPPWALPKVRPNHVADSLSEKALAILRPAATDGLAALELAWKNLPNDLRKVALPYMAELKRDAADHTPAP